MVNGIENTLSTNDDVLNQIIDNTQAIHRESDRDRMKLQLSQFLSEVSSGAVVISSDLVSSIEERVSSIDKLLSEQISLIIHAPEFQKRESSWRGLHKLVQSSVTENTKIRLLQTTKQELIKDFKSASDFDQSTLFKCVYESEYGTFGGTP
ncbi:type VI secretion system contractile sheath large subunit, partial [Salmonella enterica subsp. enterica serovar Kinondoni]|nr:type VI secretion system contractile sheath large subunit [Salmonella enterica subsp. enterica serovar Kinondoni]